MVKILSAKNLALCAMFTALIAIGAFIRIPVPILPFTLQVLFVTLCGLLLGPRLAPVSVGLYVALGLIGLPIFTMGGGIGYVLQPSFGYLLGMICSAALTGYVSAKLQGKWRYFLSGLIGLIPIYTFGLIYYYMIANCVIAHPIGVWMLLLHCFIMTLPGDIVSILLCSVLAKKLNRVRIA